MCTACELAVCWMERKKGDEFQSQQGGAELVMASMRMKLVYDRQTWVWEGGADPCLGPPTSSLLRLCSFKPMPWIGGAKSITKRGWGQSEAQI